MRALTGPAGADLTLQVRSLADGCTRPDELKKLQLKTFDADGKLAELNGDVAATANVTLWQGPTPLTAPKTIDVPAGGRASVSFAGVGLTAPVPVELTVRVSEVAPAETDATNDARSTTVDVTEHELAKSRLVLDNLGGYGAQFNHHVFAKLTPAPPGTIGGLEPKVDALEPQLARIFYNDDSENPAKFRPRTSTRRCTARSKPRSLHAV